MLDKAKAGCTNWDSKLLLSPFWYQVKTIVVKKMEIERDPRQYQVFSATLRQLLVVALVCIQRCSHVRGSHRSHEGVRDNEVAWLLGLLA